MTIRVFIDTLLNMSGLELLNLKQQLSRLSETERKDVAAFLVRLEHETDEWKNETARRLDEMGKGNQTDVNDLRKKLGLRVNPFTIPAHCHQKL